MSWFSIRTMAEELVSIKTMADGEFHILVSVRTMANREGPSRTLVTELLSVKAMPKNSSF